jgi:hypothetical protein
MAGLLSWVLRNGVCNRKNSCWSPFIVTLQPLCDSSRASGCPSHLETTGTSSQLGSLLDLQKVLAPADEEVLRSLCKAEEPVPL